MLTGQQLQDIKALQKRCEQYENIKLKLNWEMLENRKNELKEDFFHYENGQLVGFIGIYRFGNKAELCGMVDPSYRRQGIFTKLYNVAKAGLTEDHQIYMNTPALSDTAKAWIKVEKLPLSFSERQMKFNRTTVIRIQSDFVQLEEAKEADIPTLAELDRVCFEFEQQEAISYNEHLLKSKENSLWKLMAEGETIGKIRIQELDSECWIYGFAIFPQFQGKGYGKEVLLKVIQHSLTKGLDVFLEVDGLNVEAKGLYEKVGFETYEVQDYFKIK
ncbi:GNAT family N-acetyltransferase [Alkalihalobacillus pseudalcaliphilus]|uniref:GNAT family N-acetyltransferase n=1 Tax=Alkalihalobacillus pseudalcaliphilus TaxID=79884 RepID=UPI00064E01B4|nr:GNAT family N-acetyltransferase [Alkalihalobacillus pseudalcaliphilus]KMK75570.1 hypothetical protein AB990_09775 [Alkalihalobacillus pseudalcaliphilus]